MAIVLFSGWLCWQILDFIGLPVLSFFISRVSIRALRSLKVLTLIRLFRADKASQGPYKVLKGLIEPLRALIRFPRALIRS